MGKFVHIELNTKNADNAKAFYTNVFGWKLTDMEMPGEGYPKYTMAEGMMNPGIGLQNVADPNMPSQWVPYIDVDDVKKTVEKAVAAGAQAPVPYFAAGDFGEGAWLIDPTGAVFAIWHSTTPPAPEPEATKKKATKRKATKKKATKKKATKRKATKKKATKRKTTKKKATKRKATKKKATKRKATKKKTTKRKATKKKATKRKATKKKATKRKAAKKKTTKKRATKKRVAKKRTAKKR